MIASVFAYVGFVCLLAGLALIVRPIAALGIRTPRHALALAGTGVVIGLVSLAAPAFTSRVSAPASRLDEFTPEWQFHELHQRHIAATPARVFDAIKQVRADEIAFFNTLTWIRRFGRPLPPGILNAGHEPIVTVAIKGGFIALADEAPREIVLGTVVVTPGKRPALTPALFASPPPGYAVGTLNFLVTSDGAGGSWLSTETRVRATSPSARRQFAAYWRVIYPGSALIRRMWLRAIERRAIMT